jgi:hypothetical protein
VPWRIALALLNAMFIARSAADENLNPFHAFLHAAS